MHNRLHTIAPLISIVICTFNRAELLHGALQTLVSQRLDNTLYEIIVVDNNSTDTTRQVCEDAAGRNPHVRYCLEIQQGLSHARNRGWREARGEYVAYVDDDCKVPEQWVDVAAGIIKNISPAVFGGPHYAFYNTAKPPWYKDSYASHEAHQAPRILTHKECVNIFGMNMVFRRTLLQLTKGFDTGLGMSGNKIAYGEETALLLFISGTQPDQLIYYDPALFVYHLVREEKMRLPQIIYQRFILGQYVYRVFNSDRPLATSRCQLLKQAVVTCLALAKDFIWGIIKRDRNQYPYFQNYLIEHSCEYVSKLGELYEIATVHRGSKK